jgi:beta-aspartyl-dipeptidase (metallo-type)
LYDAFQEAVRGEGIPLPTALLPFTSNPARILKLRGKGRIQAGQDADLILVDRASLELHTVIAKGCILMSDGNLKARGTFERASMTRELEA